MAINEDLIKKILIRLNEVYPKEIEKMESILPEYEDQEEICLHLFHLQSIGHVDFVDMSSSKGKACINIKITPLAIENLKSFV